MEKVKTENRNKNTINIDLEPTEKIVELLNNEDLTVAVAVQKELSSIAAAVDIIAGQFLSGGRLIYFGAGTSGRLGVLDASECPPTFGTAPELVQGVIAGGDEAIKNAIEGAEDSETLAKEDVNRLCVKENDTVVAISASGNAKYVIESLRLAKSLGARTIAVTSNKNALMLKHADCSIVIDTGEEAVTGSTRLKAGTAQKMVLNMLTTAAMIKLGKTYENLMIDLKPTNDKLKIRAASIVSEIARCETSTAEEVLHQNGYKVKHAILKIKHGIEFKEAEALLLKHNGVLRKVLLTLET